MSAHIGSYMKIEWYKHWRPLLNVVFGILLVKWLVNINDIFSINSYW
jgi:hypothetical protein